MAKKFKKVDRRRMRSMADTLRSVQGKTKLGRDDFIEEVVRLYQLDANLPASDCTDCGDCEDS